MSDILMQYNGKTIYPFTRAENVSGLDSIIKNNYDFDNEANYDGCRKETQRNPDNLFLEKWVQKKDGKIVAKRATFFDENKAKIKVDFYDFEGNVEHSTKSEKVLNIKEG